MKSLVLTTLMSFPVFAGGPINEKSGYIIINKFFHENLFPDNAPSGSYEVRLYVNGAEGIIGIWDRYQPKYWYNVDSNQNIIFNKTIKKKIKNRMLVNVYNKDYVFSCAVGLTRIVN